MIQTQTSIRVRYAETDKMGLVYHGNYLTWFEAARVEMLDIIGYPYKQLEEEGFFLPVLEINVRYRRPAFFDDRLSVRVTIKEKPLVKIHCDYEVLRHDELLATGWSRHGFINPQGEPVRPPRPLIDLMGSHFA
ncbi:acyl-CoA thioesterase [Ruficoccus amylovorans]|uniref:Acyl-CoA thioesterase n=1 Tax=Ruficoccus amylovorans TaxID=1804625 RepID=A0A842HH39_9BACT|nr:thioesterase family protein [Ruficoccus amylovorans]MBC2596045.1 acyl-CoA thioesterase [Ruficoccus amylovorans]